MTNFAAKCAAPGRSRNPAWLVLAVVVWTGLLALGILLMLRHDFTPGLASGGVPDRWPAHAGLRQNPGVPTLVMAVHPNCPCSRASVEQLERIASRIEHPVQVLALFFDAPALEKSRALSATWKRVANNPGLHAVVDGEGRLAKRFGLTTSGEALFYDAAGQLQFHGGLTASRGHSEPGKGCEAVLALIAGRRVERPSFPTFGCPVQNLN